MASLLEFMTSSMCSPAPPVVSQPAAHAASLVVASRCAAPSLLLCSLAALPIISSGQNAQDVVEVMSGFVASAHGGHIPVQLPLQRDGVAPAEAAVQVASARL